MSNEYLQEYNDERMRQIYFMILKQTKKFNKNIGENIPVINCDF